MAKKDKKKHKKDTGAGATDAVGAVRTAVERTFQATAESAQSTRGRAQELVDEVAGAAGRVRGMIEDLNLLEDLKGLRSEVETLAKRVADLEVGRGRGTAPSRKPATPRKSSASRKSTTARKATAARKTTAARKATATRKSTAARKTTATRKSTAARKPASSRSASTGVKSRSAPSSRSSGSRAKGAATKKSS
jgi:polyhydroxyalkanoate synthesis regulator phasin